MKIGPVLTGVLVASASSSHSQAEAKLPFGKGGIPLSRGLCTGAISSGVKSLVADLQAAYEEGQTQEIDQPLGDIQNSTRVEGKGVIRRAAKNFPLSFSANAVATTYVDKLFCVSKKATVKNIVQLALPIASMELTREALTEAKIPKAAKEALSISAFWAGAMVQGKAPVTSALSITGFVAGASLSKSIRARWHSKADEDHLLAKDSKPTPGVSASAVSGFLSPAASETKNKAAPASYDDFIRQRYGMKEGEKFWMGPDGSVFVPIDKP